MDVAAGEQVGAGAGEGVRRVLGENDGRRSRPATPWKQSSRRPSRSTSTVGSNARRYSRSSVGELREAPLALRRAVAPSCTSRAGVRIEQEGVGVAQHHAGAHAAQELEALGRLRPALCHVAEGDDQVGTAPLDVVERRAQPDGVAVRVRDQGDAHSPSGGARGTRAGRSGSARPRACPSRATTTAWLLLAQVGEHLVDRVAHVDGAERGLHRGGDLLAERVRVAEDRGRGARARSASRSRPRASRPARCGRPAAARSRSAASARSRRRASRAARR